MAIADFAAVADCSSETGRVCSRMSVCQYFGLIRYYISTAVCLHMYMKVQKGNHDVQLCAVSVLSGTKQQNGFYATLRAFLPSSGPLEQRASG